MQANVVQFRLETEGSDQEDAADSDNFSLQNYPMDGHKTATLGQQLLVQIVDLACIVYEFCCDHTLLKLSMTCKKVRLTLTSENTSERAIKRGFLIRILKHKYSRAGARL